MKHFLVLVLVLLTTNLVVAQDTLSDLLKRYNTMSVPYITVQELAMPNTNLILLDARELEEYKVSHLKNASYVGYQDFNIELFETEHPEKDSPFVVYCSLGIRSETIAEKLKKAGYENVYNLYGGIFEWKNNAFPIVNSREKETDSIHAFSKLWGKWLYKGIKVYH
ncbi:MAG: rhodanese-like domain-containing protein [Aquaticitalea sp.]